MCRKLKKQSKIVSKYLKLVNQNTSKVLKKQEAFFSVSICSDCLLLSFRYVSALTTPARLSPVEFHYPPLPPQVPIFQITSPNTSHALSLPPAAAAYHRDDNQPLLRCPDVRSSFRTENRFTPAGLCHTDPWMWILTIRDRDSRVCDFRFALLSFARFSSRSITFILKGIKKSSHELQFNVS